MTVTFALAVIAILTGIVALVVAVRAARSVAIAQHDLESVSMALDHQRELTAQSVATSQQATIDEVTELLENHLSQVDTETAARVAEALARLNTDG